VIDIGNDTGRNINALNGVGVVELKENIKPNEQGSMTLIIVRKEL